MPYPFKSYIWQGNRGNIKNQVICDVMAGAWGRNFNAVSHKPTRAPIQSVPVSFGLWDTALKFLSPGPRSDVTDHLEEVYIWKRSELGLHSLRSSRLDCQPPFGPHFRSSLPRASFPFGLKETETTAAQANIRSSRKDTHDTTIVSNRVRLGTNCVADWGNFPFVTEMADHAGRVVKITCHCYKYNCWTKHCVQVPKAPYGHLPTLFKAFLANRWTKMGAFHLPEKSRSKGKFQGISGMLKRYSPVF